MSEIVFATGAGGQAGGSRWRAGERWSAGSAAEEKAATGAASAAAVAAASAAAACAAAAAAFAADSFAAEDAAAAAANAVACGAENAAVASAVVFADAFGAGVAAAVASAASAAAGAAVSGAAGFALRDWLEMKTVLPPYLFPSSLSRELQCLLACLGQWWQKLRSDSSAVSWLGAWGRLLWGGTVAEFEEMPILLHVEKETYSV